MVAILGSGWLATKFGTKGWVIVGLCVTPVAGCIILLTVSRSDAHKGILLFGYYIVSTITLICEESEYGERPNNHSHADLSLSRYYPPDLRLGKSEYCW